jgi:hypothetical protein
MRGRRYEVYLHCRGLKLRHPETGEIQVGGVYVARAVEARDESEAVAKAQEELLRDSRFLSTAHNESFDELSIEIDEIRRELSPEGSGAAEYVYYLEESK